MTPHVDGYEPIDDKEILYRRIPVSTGWFDPNGSPPMPSPNAFRPRPDDLTGISLSRGLPYNTAEQAASGASKQGYFVAVLQAGDLVRHGLRLAPKPLAENLGHVELLDLHAANRNSEEAKAIMDLLAFQLCLRVEGPFLPAPP